MPNDYFRFKQFTVFQGKAAMKVTTDGCLFGAWAATKLAGISMMNPGGSVLDIGTGTGLLALMLAQQCPFSVDAVEMDADAAQQARENFRDSPWAERLHVIEANVASASLNGPYDFIISNPPFYENELSGPDNQRNLAHHSSGLSFTDLKNVISTQLKEDGSAFLLLPTKKWDDRNRQLREGGFIVKDCVYLRQTPRHDFFRVMIEITMKGDEKNESVLVIRDGEGKYTGEFEGLLGEYYLKIGIRRP